MRLPRRSNHGMEPAEIFAYQVAAIESQSGKDVNNSPCGVVLSFSLAVTEGSPQLLQDLVDANYLRYSSGPHDPKAGADPGHSSGIKETSKTKKGRQVSPPLSVKETVRRTREGYSAQGFSVKNGSVVCVEDITNSSR